MSCCRHMTVSIVETLFMWMDTLAALLLSVGFGLLSTVAEERAKAIVTRKQTLVSPHVLPMLRGPAM